MSYYMHEVRGFFLQNYNSLENWAKSQNGKKHDMGRIWLGQQEQGRWRLTMGFGPDGGDRLKQAG